MGRQRGFTLTEVLVVVAILGILAAFAGPNMMSMIRVQRVKTATFDLFSSLNFARSEAIKRNLVVTLTPNAGGWASGWEIKDSNDVSLRKQAGWDTLTVSGPSSVSFSGTGRLTAAVGPFSLQGYDVPATGYRCVTVDLSGRAVSKEGAC